MTSFRNKLAVMNTCGLLFLAVVQFTTRSNDVAAIQAANLLRADGRHLLAESTTDQVVVVESSSSLHNSLETPRAKLGDGCFHIFLDVGANIGVHGRFLYEPDAYPDAKIAHSLFNEQFGVQRDNRDFCVFAFEPNPSQHEKIRARQDAYAAMGWRYHLIPHGVSDENSVIQFYRQGDEKRSEWGFNALQTKNPDKDSVKVEVQVIRLADWLQEHVYNRRLPDKIYGSYQGITDKNGQKSAPKVVMKMDVEGMEFRVLPDLLYSGVYCRDLDYVFGEIHKSKKWYPMKLPQDIAFETREEGIAYMQSFVDAIKVNPSCKVPFVEKDDEAYLLDGIPLPTPAAGQATAV